MPRFADCTHIIGCSFTSLAHFQIMMVNGTLDVNFNQFGEHLMQQRTIQYKCWHCANIFLLALNDAMVVNIRFGSMLSGVFCESGLS